MRLIDLWMLLQCGCAPTGSQASICAEWSFRFRAISDRVADLACQIRCKVPSLLEFREAFNPWTAGNTRRTIEGNAAIGFLHKQDLRNRRAASPDSAIHASVHGFILTWASGGNLITEKRSFGRSKPGYLDARLNRSEPDHQHRYADGKTDLHSTHALGARAVPIVRHVRLLKSHRQPLPPTSLSPWLARGLHFGHFGLSVWKRTDTRRTFVVDTAANTRGFGSSVSGEATGRLKVPLRIGAVLPPFFALESDQPTARPEAGTSCQAG